MVYRDKERTDRVYAEALKHVRDGHAVFPALATTILKPGICGYFDRNGDWQTIVNLACSKDVEKNKFTKIPAFTVSSPTAVSTTETYRVKLSQNLHAVSVDGKALAQQLGFGGGVAVKYQATSEHAAVLLTRGPISRSATNAQRSFFMDWVKENTLKILQEARHPDVQEMGLWVITKTTSAKHRAFSVAKAKGTEIHWGITAEAQQGGKLEASTSWWTNHQSSEWMSDWDEKGLVIFMQGIYWKPRGFSWLRRSLRPVLDKEKQQYLGPMDKLPRIEVVLRDGEEGEGLWLEPELWPSDDEGDGEPGGSAGLSENAQAMQEGANTTGFSLDDDLGF